MSLLQKFQRPIWLLAAGLAFLSLAIAYARVAPPNSNEAWFADAGRNLWLHGRLATTILSGQGTWLDGVDRHTYWIMPLHPMLQSVWYALVGFGLLELRLLSVFAGLGLVLAWYSIARRFLESQGAVWAALLILAVDARMVLICSNGRMDALCAMLGALGLCSYLALRESRPAVAVFVGHTCVALSGLTHPCGAIYAFDLLLLQWWFGDLRRIVPTGAPYVILGVPMLAWIGQDWQSFYSQFTGNVSGLAGEYSGDGRFSAWRQPWFGLEGEISNRYLRAAGGMFGSITMWVYLAGLVWMAVRPSLRQRGTTKLLCLLATAQFGFFWWLEGLKLANYTVHTIPALLLLTIVAGRDLLGASRPLLVGAASLVVVLNGLAIRENYVYAQSNDRQAPVRRLLSEFGGRQITAPAEFAFALGFDGQLVDDYRLGYYTGRRPDVFAMNEWQQLWLRNANRTEANVVRAIEQRLREDYVEVYRNPSYALWRRVESNTGR